VLRQAIDDGAENPEVYYVYGKALSETGEPDAAVWPLRRAMESPAWEVPAALQLATGAFRQRNWDSAIKTLDHVLELESENTQALVLRSRSRIESRRDYEGALADAERALEIDPDANIARISRVVALLALDRADEAAEALGSMELLSREAGPDQPETARFCGARASFAMEKGEPEVADEIYAACLEEFPGDPVLVTDAIKYYEGLGHPDRTIEILEAAVEASPHVRDYRMGLAFRLRAQGRGEDAKAILRVATEVKNPTLAAEAWLDLGGYLMDDEQYSEGVEAFESALELVPNPAADLMFRYADALIVAEQTDRALEVAEGLQASAHRDLILGRVHLERGEAALALERFDAGLQLWPENAVARYYTALAAEGVGDYERAIEEFRYSIRAGASQTDARARLARLHLTEGLPREAYDVLMHDIGRQPADAEMAIVGIEIGARLGMANPAVEPLTAALRSPDDWRQAILAAARGTRFRVGPAAAAQLIRASPDLDLENPLNASLLERLVIELADSDRVEEAVALLGSCLEAKPESGAFHAIHGWILARRDGVESEPSREALLRALELEPDNSVALIGLGRDRIAAGEPDNALAYFEKAILVDSADPAPLREAIEMLRTEGRTGEAEVKLEELLELEPYDAGAALLLARLRVDRNAEKPHSIALGRLAARFGKGRQRAAAIELLKELGAPPI